MRCFTSRQRFILRDHTPEKAGEHCYRNRVQRFPFLQRSDWAFCDIFSYQSYVTLKRHSNRLFLILSVSYNVMRILNLQPLSALHGVMPVVCQADELLSCLLSGIWQGTEVTCRQIEWHSCKKVSCQQARYHDPRAEATLVLQWNLTLSHQSLSDSFMLTRRIPVRTKLQIKQKTTCKNSRSRCRDRFMIFYF